MKTLTIMVSLLLVGCGTTTKEMLAEANACKNSLVVDETTSEVRVRTQAEVDRDCGELFKKWDRRVTARDEKKPTPKCPPGMVAVCNGTSCGRIRSHRQDWTCQDRGFAIQRIRGIWAQY
jgi:hypothetical protein